MRKSTKTLLIMGVFLVSGVGAAQYIAQSSRSESPTEAGDGASRTQDNERDGLKTFIFEEFHGSKDLSLRFSYQYPGAWHRSGQYLSPQKVQYYTKNTVKAPIYFDLIETDIFHLTELQYQIDNSTRLKPDTTGVIDGQQFKRYDLTDYGSYGGDSAGHVKIFVGPQITIDGIVYTLVFHWEERPLAEYVAGNNISVFDNLMLSLDFL